MKLFTIKKNIGIGVFRLGRDGNGNLTYVYNFENPRRKYEILDMVYDGE